MDQPFLDATRVERNNRQSITHCLWSNHSEGFWPYRWDHKNAGIPVILSKFFRWNEAAELHPVSQVEPGAEPLAMRAMIPFSQNQAFKRHAELCQSFQQYIHPFAANDLSCKKNQISITE